MAIKCPCTKLYVVVYSENPVMNGFLSGKHFVNKTRLSAAEHRMLKGRQYKEFTFDIRRERRRPHPLQGRNKKSRG